MGAEFGEWGDTFYGIEGMTELQPDSIRVQDSGLRPERNPRPSSIALHFVGLIHGARSRVPENPIQADLHIQVVEGFQISDAL